MRPDAHAEAECVPPLPPPEMPDGGRGCRSDADADRQARVEARFCQRRERRRKAIDRLVDSARQTGDVIDRLYWTMVYDFEMAPLTTNLAQLADIGVAAPLPEELDDPALAAKLAEIVAGLAELNVFLLHTDHLDDRALYTRLRKRILLEEVREVPADPGVREYIDLLAPGDGEDYDELLDAYASSDLEAPPDQRTRPEFFVADRDRHLPRPDDSEGGCSAA